MSRPTPQIRNLATRLIAWEISPNESSQTKSPAAFRVCEKLRPPLGKLLGVAGFQALLARALVLANAEVPSPRALKIKVDGSLEGLDELEAKLDLDEIARSEVVLVTQFLELLVTFIGPALTLRLLHDIWPKMEDLNF